MTGFKPTRNALDDLEALNNLDDLSTARLWHGQPPELPPVVSGEQPAARAFRLLVDDLLMRDRWSETDPCA